MKPTKKQPLFIVTGASGVGKSTACEILFENETDYIVLESDIIWNEVYNTPENGYRGLRKVQIKLCANISQIGLPVVLCGCAVPDQFTVSDADNTLFSGIYFAAIVSDSDSLKSRMVSGRKITDENWMTARWNLTNG